MKEFYSFRGRRRLLGQAGLAILYLWLVLFLLDQASISELAWAAGAGSLASSAFIVFALPRTSAARPMHIFCGYLICMMIGIFFHQINDMFALAFPDHATHIFEFIAAFSIGISMIAMLFFHCGHPPAAGLTLVLVIERWNYSSLAIVVFAICVLIFLRLCFKNYVD